MVLTGGFHLQNEARKSRKLEALMEKMALSEEDAIKAADVQVHLQPFCPTAVTLRLRRPTMAPSDSRLTLPTVPPRQMLLQAEAVAREEARRCVKAAERAKQETALQTKAAEDAAVAASAAAAPTAAVPGEADAPNQTAATANGSAALSEPASIINGVSPTALSTSSPPTATVDTSTSSGT